MRCPKTLIIPALAAVFLQACAPADAPAAPQETPASVQSEPAEQADASAATASGDAAQPGVLPAIFDCVREEKGLVIAAHRGGPDKGYPENAVETLQHALNQGIRVMEVDVAESRDGTLFLMHDRSLGRTTSGSGPVADTAWAEISQLRLVDNDGTVTRFTVPTLEAALDWAVANGAVLELDRKETTSFRNIIEAVRGAEAQDNVIIITYNDEEALQVASLAPDLMMTAGIGDREHEAQLLAAGVDKDNLIAWTGTSRPNPGKWRGLASSGIESAFGTLGRPGDRLDDQYWEDGNPEEYHALASGGLTMLATDTPYRVAAAGGETQAAVERANARCFAGG